LGNDVDGNHINERTPAAEKMCKDEGHIEGLFDDIGAHCIKQEIKEFSRP
jgi:hypothetical protein